MNAVELGQWIALGEQAFEGSIRVASAVEQFLAQMRAEGLLEDKAAILAMQAENKSRLARIEAEEQAEAKGAV